MQEIPQPNDETNLRGTWLVRCLDGICFDLITYREDFIEEM